MSDETPSASGWPAWIDEWVLPYLENRALWPVWVAVIGHVVVAVAGIVLVGLRTGLPEAWIGVGLAVVGSAWLVVREARASGPGGVTLTVVLAWLGALGLVGLAEATGIF